MLDSTMGNGACLLLLCWAPSVVAPPAAAQSRRLNGPLAQPGTGDVQTYAITADGARVLYVADQDIDGLFELFSTPADASAPPLRLSGDMPANGDVLEFASASQRVVYRADQDQDERFELYSVPAIGGAAPVRLNGTLPAQGDVEAFWIVEGGATVLFSVTLSTAQRQLFRVPADAGAAPTLLTPGQNFRLARVAPDGAVAVLVESLPTNDERLLALPTDGSGPPQEIARTAPPLFSVFTFVNALQFTGLPGALVYEEIWLEEGQFVDIDLRGVPLDGSQPSALLAHSGSACCGPFDFRTVPSSLRTLYLAPAFPSGAHLRAVQLDGSQNTLLHSLDLRTSHYRSTLDGTRVVFAARNPLSQEGLFLVNVDGSGGQTLITPDELTVETLDLTADATVAVATTVASGFGGLHSVVLGGGSPPVLLNGPPVAGREALDPTVSLDGTRVVFRWDHGADDAFELWSVPTDGSLAPVRLSLPLSGPLDVLDFALSTDGQLVVYRADQDDDQTFELHGAPIDGSAAPVRYNRPLVPGPVRGDVLAAAATSDGQRVVYLADQDEDEAFDLYAVELAAPETQARLTNALGEGGDALAGFALAPSDDLVVFPFRIGNDHSLRVVAIAGGLPALELDQSSMAFPGPFAIDAEATCVVYRRPRVTPGDHDLFRARLDGLSGPTRLHPPLPAGRSVESFERTPDGQRVIALADVFQDDVLELYSAAVEGGAAPIRLTALPPTADVGAFHVTADSVVAVYLADADTDEVVELFRVPVNGTAPPVKLNDALVAPDAVLDLALTPLGERVVYRVRLAQRVEIFSAPTSGIGPPARLTPLSGSSRVAADYALTPDGATVVYRANPSGGFELFRVPVDGSAAPVPLSLPPVFSANVIAFALAPDGSRAAYLRDVSLFGMRESYSVPVAGGPSRLLDSQSITLAVQDFRIDADSSHLVIRADRNQPSVFELFAIRLDTGQPVRRLNGVLPAGGNVEADFLTLPGGRIVYRADQESNDVVELFSSALHPGHDPLQTAAPMGLVDVVH